MAAALGASLSLCAATHGQDVSISAGLDLSQVYQPSAWQPIRLELRNLSDRVIDGSAVLPLNDDDAAPAVMTLPISVPARGMVRATVSGYFPAQLKFTLQQKREGRTPPLSVVEWRSRGGAMLSRADVMGLPFTGVAGDDGLRGEMVLLVDQRGSAHDMHVQDSSASFDLQALLTQVSDASGVPMHIAAVDPAGVPRQTPPLQPLKAIVLDGVDADVLDGAQCAALSDYVRGGGVLILSAPVESSSEAGKFLHPLLPVRVIGSRLAQQIEVTADGPPLKLREPLPIVEAVEGNGDVLLRDRDYVHVATRNVGLGKAVFTSFPINALDESQPQVAMLWQQLLSLAPPRDLAHSQLDEARHAVLASMIGQKVAPWEVAGALAGGYLVLILLAQAIFVGPSRPKAVVVSAAVAVLLSGTLLAMGFARRDGNELQSARLSILDISADGGGARLDTVAFIGADAPDLTLSAAGEMTTIRPAIADTSNPPTIRQQPFAVESAGVYATRIERVWEAQGPVPERLKLGAVAGFGERGLTLEVNNALGLPLHAPLIVWQRRAIAMEDLPAGLALANTLRINPRGDYSSMGVLTSEQDKRRAAIVRALFTPLNEQPGIIPRDEPPMLVAWVVDDVPGGGLIRPTDVDGTIERKSMTMVRTPVRFEPPMVGTKIAVPAALVKLDPGRLLYDVQKGESVPSQETGQWLVRFAAPAQLGQVRPAKATLELRVNLPGHKLSVYKTQVSDGLPRINRDGELVAEWTRDVGLKSVTFDCTAADVDREGGVPLFVEIAPAGAAAATPVPWQIKDLGLAIEGEAVAPPKAISLEPPLRPVSMEDSY